MQQTSKQLTISVIIPVHNEQDYIEACLKALMQQTIPPLEIIVVDNNSDDDTLAIIGKFTSVKLLKEQRQGTVFARNSGFDVASGTILARLDADSVVPPDWTKQLATHFADDPSDAAASGRGNYFDVYLPRLVSWLQVGIYQYFQKCLTGSYFLWGANMAIRAEIWQEVRGDCSQRTDLDEDIDLTLVLRARRKRIAYTPKLSVSASLRRGKLSWRQIVGYLDSWPKDYIQHGLYLRAAFIWLLLHVFYIIYFPFYFLFKLGK